jgi:GNAT superfamily N-acetyltransferase
MDLFGELKRLNLPTDEYVVVGSAVLQVHGLRDARDIDLFVTEDLYQRLRASGWMEKQDGDAASFLTRESFDAFRDWSVGWYRPDVTRLIAEADVIDGFRFAKLEEVWKWKSSRRREKDLEDLALLGPLVLRSSPAENIQYAHETDLSPEELGDVFRRSGIGRPFGDIERLSRMLSQSNLVVTARANGRLIGVARGWTDRAWVCFVSDLAVDGEYQRRGIGRALLNEIRQLVGDDVSIGLFAAPSAETYYPHVGFEPVSAWRIPRKR